MFWILEIFEPTDLFLFSLFPAIGLIFSRHMSERTTPKVLITVLVLIFSSLSSYYILTVWLYKLAFLVLMSIIFAYFTEDFRWKLALTVLLTGLFVLGSFVYYMYSAFNGHYETTFLCRKGDYKIESRTYQAFVGRSAPTYNLYYSPLRGLLNKKIDSIWPDSFKEAELCTLRFKNGIVYDRCKNVLASSPQP